MSYNLSNNSEVQGSSWRWFDLSGVNCKNHLIRSSPIRNTDKSQMILKFTIGCWEWLSYYAILHHFIHFHYFDVITAFESVYKIIQVNSHVFCGLIDHRKMASLSPVGDIKMVFPISTSMQNTLTLK